MGGNSLARDYAARTRSAERRGAAAEQRREPEEAAALVQRLRDEPTQEAARPRKMRVIVQPLLPPAAGRISWGHTSRHSMSTAGPGENAAANHCHITGIFCFAQSLLGLYPYMPLRMLAVDPAVRVAPEDHADEPSGGAGQRYHTLLP